MPTLPPNSSSSESGAIDRSPETTSSQGAERFVLTFAVVSTICWVLYALVAGSDAGMTIPALMVFYLGGGGLFLLWLVCCGIFVFSLRGPRLGRSLPPLLLGPASILICFALVSAGHPRKVRFRLSKPALNRFVQQEARRAPYQSKTNRRVGLYRVREVEVLPRGVVRFITTECTFDDCGFVYSPQGQPPVLGEDYYTPLAPNWWHWWRSW